MIFRSEFEDKDDCSASWKMYNLLLFESNFLEWNGFKRDAAKFAITIVFASKMR